MNHKQLSDSAYDEVSLVELAATLVRRRWMAIVPFLLCVFVGLVYALTEENRYYYITLVQAAGYEDNEPLEQPASTIALLTNRWLPEIREAFYEESGEKLPLDVEFQNPENTTLIRFRSEAVKSNSSHVRSVHRTLVDRVVERQSALTKKVKADIERQLGSVKDLLDTFELQDSQGGMVVDLLERQARLERRLSSLSGPELLSDVKESIDKAGPRRSLIMVIAGIGGLVLGICLAFLAEFSRSVGRRLRESDAR